MHFIPDGFHSSAGDIHCHHTITGVEVLEEGFYSLLMHQKAPLEREVRRRKRRGGEGREGGKGEGGTRREGRGLRETNQHSACQIQP